MTKLISGRVHKVPSANVSADRYEFIELSETEPDLGLPSQLGQVFTSDLAGFRRWTRLDTANVSESPSNLYFTNDRVTANVANLSIGTLFNVRLGANLTTGKALVYDGNVNAFVPVFVNSEVANIADLAGKVLSLENQTTANVREASSNLYYTNTRVFDAIAFVDTLNTKNLNVNGNLTIAGTFAPTLAANGNVSAYATQYIVQYNPTSKALTYSSTPDASNPYITGYSQEIHVSPVAFNDSGKGTIGDPVKTIAKAKQLLSLAFETTGVGQRKTIILHPGDYAEDVTIDTQYTVLTTHELIGKSTTLTGNLTLATGCTIDGLKMARLIVTGTSANGTVDLIGCTVTTTATKTGTAYTVFRGCDLSSATLSITGAGSTVLNGGNYGSVTVNNASAGVLAKALITMGPTTLTAGTLQISDTIVYAATNTSNAITQSAGSVLTFNNSQALIPDLTNVARINLGGFYSILHSVYDKNNSTLSGTSLNAISYSQIINVDSLQGNVIGTVSTLSNHTTSNLAEGNVNLYYTNARTVQTVTPLLTTGNVVETTNQYFTNARVLANVEQMSMNVFADVDMSGIGVNGILIWNGTKFVPGASNAEFANLANVSLFSNIANTVLSLSNFTTANLLEASSNLYFTNARAIGAFTAGRGIIIQDNGVIKSTIGSDLFSTTIDGTVGYTVNNTMSPAVTFPSTPTTSRFILRSMQITNISNQIAFVSSNVLYSTSNTALLANKIGVPVGASLEFIKRPQIFLPGDKINLQGFNASEVATNDLLSASFTYETINDDITYNTVGRTLYASNNNITLLAPDQSYAIVESLKFVNHHTDDVTITALWADANSVARAYFAFNMPVPASSSMEVLQAPKKINTTDKLIVRYGNAANNLVSAFASYRVGSITNPVGITTLANTGGTVSINLQTTIPDGTTLYYTIS